MHRLRTKGLFLSRYWYLYWNRKLSTVYRKEYIVRSSKWLTKYHHHFACCLFKYMISIFSQRYYLQWSRVFLCFNFKVIVLITFTMNLFNGINAEKCSELYLFLHNHNLLWCDFIEKVLTTTIVVWRQRSENNFQTEKSI